MKLLCIVWNVLVLCLFFNNCGGQLQIVLPLKEKNETEKPDLISKNLNSVYEIAKNLSNSRGIYMQPDNSDSGFRRSYMKKVVTEAKSDVLRTNVLIAQRNGDDLFEALNNIEYLVHQFDVALDFVKIGGVELVLPLTQHQDVKISSVAFSVLTAAMQGNQVVQEYAGKAKILDFITDVLTSNSGRVFQSVLYTLSSYLRNMPKAQLHFFDSNGVAILASILKAQNETVKAKLKVMDLLSDLSTEIYTSSESKTSKKLRKLLEKGLKDNKLCDEIPSFLTLGDYTIHDKVVDAMISLFPFCSDEFSLQYVIDSTLTLQHTYDPLNKYNWYSKHDPEMLWLISEKFKLLYEKVIAWKFRRKIDF